MATLLRSANGSEVPLVALGTYLLQNELASDIVYSAIKTGYRHIDCASFYGNETEIGQGIKRAISEGLVTREDLFVTSKLWNDAHARDQVEPALKKSLQRLDLDYLDLYLVHWPVSLNADGEACDIPMTETWTAMKETKDANLTRFVGMCNVNYQLLRELMAVHVPAVLQIELHPYLQQPSLVRFCHTHNIHIMAFRPLGGRLASITAAGLKAVIEEPVILEISEKLKITSAQVLISWLKSQNITAIPKTSQLKRVESNFKTYCLDTDSQKQIKSLDIGQRGVGYKGMWGVPVFD